MKFSTIWGNWLKASVFAKILNQRGEVPETVAEPEGDSAESQPDEQTDFQPSPEGGEPGQVPDGHSQPAEESFVDPSTLPPELKGHWSRMHKAFTQSREELKRGREALGIVEKFYQDPAFAEQTLQQRATQLGYQLVRPGQNGQQNGGNAGMNGANGQVAQQYVQLAESQLPDELKWMAPSLANSTATIAMQIAKQMIEPVMRNTQKQQFDTEYNRYESELTEKYPDWVQHEAKMDEIREWWQSPRLNHPQFGNKLEWLYKMATEQQSSVSEANRRMRQAVKNRSSSGHTPSHSSPNVQQQVAAVKSDDEAWQIATRHAMDVARRKGATA